MKYQSLRLKLNNFSQLYMPVIKPENRFIMKNLYIILALLSSIAFASCRNGEISGFAKTMVEFHPYENNPLFSGTGSDTWDEQIRERGFILHEGDLYRMWYTGYKDNGIKYLGYATSRDGIKWERYPGNPIFDAKWTEDVFVMKDGEKYFMYAEGTDDVAHLLTSGDGIKWYEQGDLIIISAKGDTIPGPYGTPSIIVKNGKWYLLYERNDEGIWIATSVDGKTWINVRDEPVIGKGPGKYDSGAVACNQVVKYQGKFYMYYHGSSDPRWNEPGAKSIWTSNVAMSSDLINWVKFPKNPIVEGDYSSPILVPDSKKFRLYTMHPDVRLYLPGK
jgi:sucrose-6-phosphate hydrolase SacC (GH32 family)